MKQKYYSFNYLMQWQNLTDKENQAKQLKINNTKRVVYLTAFLKNQNLKVWISNFITFAMVATPKQAHISQKVHRQSTITRKTFGNVLLEQCIQFLHLFTEKYSSFIDFQLNPDSITTARISERLKPVHALSTRTVKHAH